MRCYISSCNVSDTLRRRRSRGSAYRLGVERWGAPGASAVSEVRRLRRRATPLVFLLVETRRGRAHSVVTSLAHAKTMRVAAQPRQRPDLGADRASWNGAGAIGDGTGNESGMPRIASRNSRIDAFQLLDDPIYLNGHDVTVSTRGGSTAVRTASPTKQESAANCGIAATPWILKIGPSKFRES